MTRVILTSFAMATTALALVVWCFAHSGGSLGFASAAVGISGITTGILKYTAFN